ncbi:hypothetical protein A8M60_01710 [Nocardia farcinica]|nr:hypothetical protein A8M60_01710 [Nocardia farcinica]
MLHAEYLILAALPAFLLELLLLSGEISFLLLLLGLSAVQPVLGDLLACFAALLLGRALFIACSQEGLVLFEPVGLRCPRLLLEDARHSDRLPLPVLLDVNGVAVSWDSPRQPRDHVVETVCGEAHRWVVTSQRVVDREAPGSAGMNEDCCADFRRRHDGREFGNGIAKTAADQARVVGRTSEDGVAVPAVVIGHPQFRVDQKHPITTDEGMVDIGVLGAWISETVNDLDPICCMETCQLRDEQIVRLLLADQAFE